MNAGEYEVTDLLTDREYTARVTETYGSRAYEVFWKRKDGDLEIVAHLFVPQRGEAHDRLALSLVKNVVDMHNEVPWVKDRDEWQS